MSQSRTLRELGEFYGLPMKVTPNMCIPRMETELLVTTGKELLLGKKKDARILNLCCGSGCIACALGHELPATKRFVAVDISANALEIARENFASNRLGSRAICIQADAALLSSDQGVGQKDVIVSNPPSLQAQKR
ncbi:MAG: methyltransferase [Oscillospiraceae bacterium]